MKNLFFLLFLSLSEDDRIKNNFFFVGFIYICYLSRVAGKILQKNFCNNLIIIQQREREREKTYEAILPTPGAAQSEKAFEKASRERIRAQSSRFPHVYSLPTKLASSANWVNGKTFAFVGSRRVLCDFPTDEKPPPR